MANFNIEAYLEGELSDPMLEAFEAEMRNNPEFTKMVNHMRQVKEDLEMQSLREEVTNILKTDGSDPENPKRPKPWLGFLAGFALLCVIGYFFMNGNQKDLAPQINPSTEEEQIDPVNETKEEPQIEENKTVPERKEEQKEKPTIVKPPKKKKRERIMAENTAKLPPPLHPAPNVRGQNDDNKEWKAMLDKLWYTDFPPIDAKAPYAEAADLLKERNFKKAFVKLELLEMKSEATDTLRFLKGYCLLEMGEGGDALRYFEQMEMVPRKWQGNLEWYRALGTLTSKGIADAIPNFEGIAKDKKHPFSLQAKKALEVIE